MKAKSKKKTFAQRAKDIEKKYSRAKFDPIEQADMEAELQALMEEQEAIKQAMDLQNPQEQSSSQGNMLQYPIGGFIGTNFGTGPFYNKNYEDRLIGMKEDQLQTAIGDKKASLKANRSLDRRMGKVNRLQQQSDYFDKELGTAPASTVPGTDPNQVLNYADFNKWVSGLEGQDDVMNTQKKRAGWAAGIAGVGNIGLALASLRDKEQAGKVSSGFAQTAAERVNLEPARDQLRRDADVAMSVNRQNIRNVGGSRGQMLTGMGAGNAAVDRNLGANLTQSYLGEETTNAELAQQAGLANAQMRQQSMLNNAQMESRRQIVNAQLRDRYNDKWKDYVAAALEMPGSYMTNASKAEQDARTYANYLMNMYNASDVYQIGVDQNGNPIWGNRKAGYGNAGFNQGVDDVRSTRGATNSVDAFSNVSATPNTPALVEPVPTETTVQEPIPHGKRTNIKGKAMVWDANKGEWVSPWNLSAGDARSYKKGGLILTY